ncbi:hypothetical protein [Leifsonia shinshuensis]|uniref:Uncharacterized protein n=1 Tax=Leifsonia shinshuensis TaxID=150026 RepID=A0A7G6YA68_9MICO|nr:hypothetical protein [Leifsonia shinshuensis]QNE35383.1 hypothetical protein F1C12_09735 [Leifsonia shinshuensis]
MEAGAEYESKEPRGVVLGDRCRQGPRPNPELGLFSFGVRGDAFGFAERAFLGGVAEIRYEDFAEAAQPGRHGSFPGARVMAEPEHHELVDRVRVECDIAVEGQPCLCVHPYGQWRDDGLWLSIRVRGEVGRIGDDACYEWAQLSQKFGSS